MRADDLPRRNAQPTASRIRARLGIAQFLLWVACCAAYLAIANGFSSHQRTTPGILLVTFQALFVGGAWSGLCLLGIRAWFGARWIVEPGHWLLGLLGAVLAIEMVLEFVPESVFLDKGLVRNAIGSWVFVLPLFSKQMGTRWRAFFGLVVCGYVIPVVPAGLTVFHVSLFDWQASFVAAVTVIRGPVWAGALLTACWLDFADSDRRDWLHWFGAAVFLVIVVLRLPVAVNP